MLNTDYSMAESKALHLLRQAGLSFCQELDWIGKRPDSGWLTFEIKFKSRLFRPPPFWGLGLNTSQVYLRRKLREELSLRCFLIVFFEDQVYGQYLDRLESGPRYITRRGIKVYPIEAFVKGSEAVMEALNG